MADKGVIVEFDFAAMDGADILYRTTSELLAEIDVIKLDLPTEARHLAGGNYQGAFEGLFSAVKTKKTAAKAAKELKDRFVAELVKAVPSAVSSSFCGFVRTLSEQGVKVVISTRATLDEVKSAFEPILGEKVVLHQETSSCYGAVKWDAWRRASAANSLSVLSTIAVAGSGLSVKSALLAGMGAIAVINDHVAYQDFSGADDIVKGLSVATAREILGILRIG